MTLKGTTSLTSALSNTNTGTSLAGIGASASCRFAVNVSAMNHGNAEQHDQCGDLNRGRKRQDGFGQYHGHAADSATTAPTNITPLNGEVYYVLNQLSGLEADLNNNSTTGGDHLVQQQQNSTNLSQRWAFTKLDQP
jgi:hypothetical protein